MPWEKRSDLASAARNPYDGVKADEEGCYVPPHHEQGEGSFI
jgi:hypothetical protein